MPDYKFTFVKQFDMHFEAQTEHEAWVQAMTFNANHMPGIDWKIQMGQPEHVANKPQDLPIDQGPIELDDWDVPEEDDQM